MSLHLTPKEHNENPPATWEVREIADRRWGVFQRGAEHPMTTQPRKQDAEMCRKMGFLVDMYNKEGRWFAGKTVPGWKPYTVTK